MTDRCRISAIRYRISPEPHRISVNRHGSSANRHGISVDSYRYCGKETLSRAIHQDFQLNSGPVLSALFTMLQVLASEQ